MVKILHNPKVGNQNIPGMSRPERFMEVEQAEKIDITIKRMLTYFVYEKRMVLSMLAIVVFGTFCGVYAPVLQSKAIDMIAGTVEGKFLWMLFWMLLVYLFYSGCQLLQGLIGAKISQRIVKRLREELFGKVLRLPIRYLDNHSHGDVMSRMTNDIENISTTISQSLPSFFSGILTIIGTVSIMVWYCWQLALLSCITVIFTFFATKFLAKRVRKFSREKQKLLGETNGIVKETITGYRTIVAYNHQDTRVEGFNQTSDALTKAGIRTDIFSGVMGPVMNFIGNIGFIIIAIFGGYFAVHGLISVGVISAFIVYAKQFSRPINEIAQIYGQLQIAISGAERVFSVLDEKEENLSGKAFAAQEGADVVFKNVYFSYSSNQPVISNFTLTIPSGKKVALVGATGSGKTTIVNLLMRFYDIDSGEIWINGQNLCEVSKDSLRQNMAIVLQDTMLFSDTIENNLKYANENATQKELEEAVKMSQCREFIEMLPGGYQTVLTGSGKNLSEGQRQLLAIARAFIANPKILIMDEATSNVDTRTEKVIQDAMQLIMKNRTSIVIAHRLSTIKDADIIVVMDQGEIVESGSHEVLLEQKGKYHQLYMTQYAGLEI